MSEQVPIRDWMQWLLGASEADVIKNKAKFVDGNGNLISRGGKNDGKCWPMGSFQRPRVSELLRDVEQLQEVRTPSTPACKLIVMDGTDIGKYQATFTTEDRAMVQIASNMHCLENGSPHRAADCGSLVEGYAQDSTQGPAAAFGVPAASLVRAHYAFIQDRPEEIHRWGQTKDDQVNLLDDICQEPEKFCGGCVNGKAFLEEGQKAVTPALVSEVAGKVKVGLHCDAQVVFSRGSSRGSLSVAGQHFVDQICSATLCYGFANAAYNPPAHDLESLTRALLRAAYEGAYLAAIKRERKVLLLTLIGGASFRNPMWLILEELKRAHQLYANHRASKLEEVRLVLYDPGVAKKFEKDIEKTAIPAI